MRVCPFSPLNTALVWLRETQERGSYGDQQLGISIRHILLFRTDERRQSIWNRVDSREPMGPEDK